MIAVVILLRVLARMSWWRKQVIKCSEFYHFAVGRVSITVLIITLFGGIK